MKNTTPLRSIAFVIAVSAIAIASLSLTGMIEGENIVAVFISHFAVGATCIWSAGKIHSTSKSWVFEKKFDGTAGQ